MDLSLSLCTITPIRHVEVTNHMFIPFYSYIIYGDSLNLPLSASPTILFISTSSYVFISLPLSSTPYPYDQGCTKLPL